MKGDEFFEAYRWLRDALESHCDEVMTQVFDHGQSFAVAARWGEGDNRVRTAVRVEREHYSLNKNIEDGKITREQVIDSVVSKRPEGWKR